VRRKKLTEAFHCFTQFVHANVRIVEAKEILLFFYILLSFW
jgi:hypothetical protein